MIRHSSIGPRLFMAAVAGLALGGCGGGNGEVGSGPVPGGSADATSESIVVDGSSTVFRISLAAQEGFAEVDPDTRVVVNKSGTGGGFGRYAAGEVDVVGASRPAKPAEEEKAQQAGLNWTRFVVGYDGITVVVNPANDFVKELTVAQLKKLYEPDSAVKTWKDLDPSWPDRRIVIYSPDNDSGTFDYFTEEVIGKSKAQRSDVQSSSDDNTLVNGVANDVDGIGYFGYAYYSANASKIKAVAIRKDDASPAVLPSPETILSKSYTPLSRPLFLYVKNAALARPQALKFVRYYLDNVADLATMAKYVAPTPDDLSANAAALQAAAAPKPAA